jgi:hypothetical protein
MRLGADDQRAASGAVAVTVPVAIDSSLTRELSEEALADIREGRARAEAKEKRDQEAHEAYLRHTASSVEANATIAADRKEQLRLMSLEVEALQSIAQALQLLKTKST